MLLQTTTSVAGSDERFCAVELDHLRHRQRRSRQAGGVRIEQVVTGKR